MGTIYRLWAVGGWNADVVVATVQTEEEAEQIAKSLCDMDWFADNEKDEYEGYRIESVVLDNVADVVEKCSAQIPKQLFKHEGYMVSEPWDV